MIDVDQINVWDGAGNSATQRVDILINNIKGIYAYRAAPLFPAFEGYPENKALVDENVIVPVNILEYDRLMVDADDVYWMSRSAVVPVRIT
mgnify:CR=1 FL=1